MSRSCTALLLFTCCALATLNLSGQKQERNTRNTVMAEKSLREIDVRAPVASRRYFPSLEHWEDEMIYFLTAPPLRVRT